MSRTVGLTLATHNRHKAGEIRAILPANFLLRDLSAFENAPLLLENTSTFAGNAEAKAMQVANWLSSSSHTAARVPWSHAGAAQEANATRPGRELVLADDSGLEVDALGGAPGVLSARFAAEGPESRGNAPDTDNNAKLLRLLEGVEPKRRTARFRCVLAVVHWPPESLGVRQVGMRLFEGVCEGRIDIAPAGGGGFGYDPLFIPDGFDASFAVLPADVKNKISHRAKALVGLQTWLRYLCAFKS